MLSKLNNKKGSAIVMVLIAMVVLFILITSFINISYSEKKQTIFNEQDKQAYYLARSGADIVADYIVKNTEEFEEKFEIELNGIMGSQVFTYEETILDGRFKVWVTNRLDGLLIKSTGYYINQEDTVYLELNTVNSPNSYIFPVAEKIVGPNTYLSTTEPTPKKDASPSNLTVTGNSNAYYDLVLNNENIYFNNITVDADKELRINTGGTDKVIIVNNITVNGFINVVDDGRVMLFIRSSGNFNNLLINATDNLAIFSLNPTTVLNINAKGDFFGYIYSPESNVTIKNNTTLKGGVIAQTITKEGTANIQHIYPSKILGLKKYIKYTQMTEYTVGQYKSKIN